MPDSRLVDTNVLVRFFTGQPPEMAAKAKALVARAEAGMVVLDILPVMVAEIIYTLESFYGMDRQEVAPKLYLFLQSKGVRVQERARVLDALLRHRHHNVHFAEAYLAAAAAELGSTVSSFDRDFDRFSDVKRAEPPS